MDKAARALAVGCQPLLVPDYGPISSHTKCLTNCSSQLAKAFGVARLLLVRSMSRVIVSVVAVVFAVFPTQGAVYEWQLSEKQAISLANAALAANHIEPSRYRWHQQVWRIIDTREWFIQFSARYPGPGGNDLLVVLNDQSRKSAVRVLPVRWSDRVETVVPQYKH